MVRRNEPPVDRGTSTNVPVKIDSDFKALVPALTAEERQQLEDNILRDGCLYPLATWNDVVLDGYSRYEICERHNLPYKTVAIELQNRDAAREWIIRNQLGRRNLTTFQRAELAAKLEPLIAARAKEKQRAAGGPLPQKSAEPPVETRTEAAKIARVSHDTYSKAKVIAEQAPEEVKEKLRAGETTIHQVYKGIRPPKPKPAVPKDEIIDITATHVEDSAEPQIGREYQELNSAPQPPEDAKPQGVNVKPETGESEDPFDMFNRHLEALKNLLPQLSTKQCAAALKKLRQLAAWRRRRR